MHVIILGGGLMGTASAYFLTQRGARVTLIDRGRVGAGATVASFGNIRRSGRYLPQMPLANRSLALWSKLETWLGLDVEFRPTGHLRLIFEQDGIEMMQQFRTSAVDWGLSLEVLEPKDIRRRFPGLGPDAIAASFSPEDGSANPRLVAPAFAAAAARAGARVLEQSLVSDIRHTANGFKVVTTSGTFYADTLLNCAGARGPDIARHFGEEVPITLAGPQMGVTEPLPHRIGPVVGVWSTQHGAYLRQVERGNVVFGGAVARTGVGEDGFAKVAPHSLPTQLKDLVKLVPALRDATVIRQWSGVEGYVDDMLPVMGPSHTTDRLFHAFGFCGHGFQLGPAVGDAMAELITVGSCSTPLAPFDIARFGA